MKNGQDCTDALGSHCLTRESEEQASENFSWKKEKEGKRQRQKCSLQGFHAFMWEEEMRWFKAAQIKKGPQEAVQDYFTRQSDQIEFFC